MLKEEKITNGLIVKRNYKFVEDPTTGTSAVKKHKIIDKTIGTGAQLTLLARVVSQLAEKASLDTPEYTKAKKVFLKINEILSE